MLKDPYDPMRRRTVVQHKADLHQPQHSRSNQGVAEQAVNFGRDREMLFMRTHTPASHDDATDISLGVAGSGDCGWLT